MKITAMEVAMMFVGVSVVIGMCTEKRIEVEKYNEMARQYAETRSRMPFV